VTLFPFTAVTSAGDVASGVSPLVMTRMSCSTRCPDATVATTCRFPSRSTPVAAVICTL
jgi:hypothetical protein